MLTNGMGFDRRFRAPVLLGASVGESAAGGVGPRRGGCTRQAASIHGVPGAELRERVLAAGPQMIRGVPACELEERLHGCWPVARP